MINTTINTTINTNTMKMITEKFKTTGIFNAAIAIALLIFLGTGKTFAQADNANCHVALSMFVEPAKVKNYDEAIKHYYKVVKECPTFTVATYQYGVKMFKHFVDKGDTTKVKDLIDAYKYQLQYFPTHKTVKEGKILSAIAQLEYDYNLKSKEELFEAFDTAFKKDEDNFTSPKSLYTYFSLAVDLFNEGKKDIQDIFDLYDVVVEKIDKEEVKLAKMLTQLLDKQEAGETLTSKEERKLKAIEQNLEVYGTVRGSVDGKLGMLADCPNLVPLYSKDFEAKKNDINWVKKAASRLSAKDCDDPLFFQLVQQLHTLDPSAESAYYLGRLAEKEGNASQALDYYLQAADLETDTNKKARYLYSIAENFRKKGSFGKARTYYRKVLEVKPNQGRAYLKIAQMYAQSANDCGSSVFEKRAVNWLAAQMADKAARVDASIASTARAAAESYRQRAPSKSDIFSEGMAGKTITFNCWIGGSVKVPNL